ncbi:hypothetical protein E1A91_D13G140800v1 [Gossypium mustelinum]|uniref:Uncharacterized protein n=1 Tax=Gossypium mustelinum TaxID=34275 RepID=A0A5D2S1I5_GOSMU|nr:hypothetical protein E1A91_D13G140800v1 [Gossypium mustelinum]
MWCVKLILTMMLLSWILRAASLRCKIKIPGLVSSLMSVRLLTRKLRKLSKAIVAMQ